MSWLTPFQNLIIRFKIGSGGSSSGGITEELLNSKLAAFYTATETKIFNLVNSKLATYVTQTAFNELETKVETNTTNISNLTTKLESLQTANKTYWYVINADAYIPPGSNGTLQNPYVNEYKLGAANSTVSYVTGLDINKLKKALLVSVTGMGIYLNNALIKTIPFIITANTTSDIMALEATTLFLTIFNINTTTKGYIRLRYLVSSPEPLLENNAMTIHSNAIAIANNETITITDITCIQGGN